MPTCKFTKKFLSHIYLHAFSLFPQNKHDYFFRRVFESVRAQFLSFRKYSRKFPCAITIPLSRHTNARVGRWTLGAGLWTLDSGPSTLDAGPWTLDSGCWTPDARLWMLDPRLWTLNAGRWTLDVRCYTLDTGLWALDTIVDCFRTKSEASFWFYLIKLLKILWVPISKDLMITLAL